jgi:hypothetical protein
VLLIVFTAEFGRATGGFATAGQAAIVTLVTGTAGYLLLARKRIAFAMCLLVPSVWAYGLVNPVFVGLGPILDTKLFREVSRIVDQDPDARWTVYGGYYTADIVKATGAQVFNGTKVLPPLKDFRVIDPTSAAVTVYNRWAHIALDPENGPEVDLTLAYGDFYSIRIDPMNDVWRRLRIRYVAFPFAVANPEFLGATSLVLELPDSQLWVYEYHWAL